MMAGFYRSGKAEVLFTLPVLALAIWASSFPGAADAGPVAAMPLFDLLAGITEGAAWTGNLIAIACIVYGGILLNGIASAHNFDARGTHIPALVFILIMSIHPVTLRLHPLAPAGLFMIAAAAKVLAIYRKEAALGTLLDAGLFTGLAALFYFPCIAVSPLIWMGLILFRSFSWREWLVPAIGLALPFAFTFAFFFLADDLASFYQSFAALRTSFDGDSARPYRIPVAPVAAFTLLAVTALLITAAGFGKRPFREKNNLWLFTWCFLLCAAAVLIFPGNAPQEFLMPAFPVALLLANYVARTRTWAGNLIVTLLLGFIIVMQIMAFVNFAP